jgi:hypothetical protein
MEKYIVTTAEKLAKTQAGLALIENLLDEADLPTIWLYGLSYDPSLLAAANDSYKGAGMLDDEMDEDDEFPGVDASGSLTGAIALAIEVNADTIQALSGSGITLRNEEFAATVNGRVEIMRLAPGASHPRVGVSAFSVMAVSSQDMYLDDFLKEFGSQQSAPKAASSRKRPVRTSPFDSLLK